MNRLPLVVLLGSLCAVSTALATTYVRVEKDGTKTYSDRPIPGGQPIDLQPAQSYSAAPASPSLSASSAYVPQEEEFKYDSCQITPAHDSTFANPESVNISASPSPGLRGNDVLLMTVDGQRANGANGQSHLMTPVDRGTHTVSVTVTSREGRVLCTATASFHVQRPNLNSPARQAPPPPRPQPRPRPGG